MVRIRLQRHGAKKRPFYRVVAADKRAPRDGRFIELLGTYDPLTEPPIVRLNKERVDYWIGVGAQPSETVNALIKKLGDGSAIDLSAKGADAAAKKANADARKAALQSKREETRKALEAAAKEAEAAAATAEAEAKAAAEAEAKAAEAAASDAAPAQDDAPAEEAAAEEAGDASAEEE